MESRFVKAWGAGCARQTLLTLAIAALVFGLAGCAVAFALFVPLPGSLENDRDIIVGGTLAVVLFLVITGTFVAGFFVLRKRGARLDAAFDGTGLAASGYMLNGRQYHGERLGRPVDAYFYRGPILDLYIGADLRTRMSVTVKDPLTSAASSIANNVPLPVEDPALQNIEVYTPDPDWARSLLADPSARSILARLVESDTSLEVPQVFIQPEAVLLRRVRVNYQFLDSVTVQRWLQDLASLAIIGESVPRTQHPLQASKLERLVRTRRNSFILPAFGLVFALILIPVIIIGFVAFLIMLISGGL